MNTEESVETKPDLPAGQSTLEELVQIFRNLELDTELQECSKILKQVNGYFKAKNS